MGDRLPKGLSTGAVGNSCGMDTRSISLEALNLICGIRIGA